MLAEDASANTRAKFTSQSQKAISTIVMAICTTQLYLVTTCEKPKEAWDTLKKHFERDTLTNCISRNNTFGKK